MRVLIADMPWLPLPPADFRKLCRAVQADEPDVGKRLQFLATHRLGAPEAAALSKAIVRCAEGGRDLSPLSPFRLGLVASATPDLLVDGLPAAAARHGVCLALTVAPYDQVLQQALDPASAVNAGDHDAVLIAVDHRWLGLERPRRPAHAQAAVDDAVARLAEVVDLLQANGRATAILQTVPVPSGDLFGSYDRRAAGSPRWLAHAVNQRIFELAEAKGAYVLDLAALAERVGLDAWFDPVQWNNYKLPFNTDLNEIVADHLGRLLGAIRGKARKCLVLDLDNTIWGGVIGDDGLDGIELGQGSAVGEAFLAVQRLALDLRERGIFLAVSSKNTEEVARGPFRHHTEMLLNEGHISVFQANWLDKPSNVEAIAKALNIGVDALVLLDDNPAERAQMRAALPAVAVPELPSDPSWYATILAAAGYFEGVGFSEEDRLRVEAQAADSLRAEVLTRSRDLGDYLASLEMTLGLAPFDRAGRQRITQLINKSNQFNLTTKRYTEAEVAAVEDDPTAFGLQVRLADRLGDLGMIGVVICRRAEDAETWVIDTWLMSCRVLGRKVEQGMLQGLVEQARAAGVRRLVGVYKPTAKNSMVCEHYSKLGFAALEADSDQASFGLALEDYKEEPLPFAFKRAFPLGAET